MHEYGMTHDTLAKIAVKSHHYGAQNPKAHLPKEIPFEEANNAIPICRPLNLYDCSLITDGAAAVVIAAEDRVKEFTDRPMWIKGIGAGASEMKIQDRVSLTSIPGAKRAAKAAACPSPKAFKSNRKEPKRACGGAGGPETHSFEQFGFFPGGIREAPQGTSVSLSRLYMATETKPNMAPRPQGARRIQTLRALRRASLT